MLRAHADRAEAETARCDLSAAIEHNRLLAAIVEGRPEAAATCARQHVLATLRTLVESWRPT